MKINIKGYKITERINKNTIDECYDYEQTNIGIEECCGTDIGVWFSSYPESNEIIRDKDYIIIDNKIIIEKSKLKKLMKIFENE